MAKQTLRTVSMTVLVIANLVLSTSFAESATSALPTIVAPAAEIVTPPAAVTPSPDAVTPSLAEPTPAPAPDVVTPAPDAAAPVEATPAADTATPATPTASAAKPDASAAEGKDPTDRKLVGRVVWAKGAFSATAPGSEEKRTLKTASHIFMNDTLITDDKSEAQIVFTDNSTITFRSNTNFYINEYNYNPKGGKAGKKSTGRYVMDLIKGGFRTVTGLVAKNNPNDYEVNTPVATIGVRGTEFSVVIAKNGELFVKRFKGEPCVANKEKGKSTEMCLDEKKKYAQVASAGSDPVALSKEPDVFNVDVDVVPVTFSGIDSSGGGSVSGFCIQ